MVKYYILKRLYISLTDKRGEESAGMELLIRGKQIYFTEERRFEAGWILVRDGRIAEVGKENSAAPACVQVLEAGDQYVAPGLVDVHTHGRIGYDFTGGSEEEMRQMRQSYAADGVTTLLPTLASAPLEQMLCAADRIRSVGFDGIHVEGRYLSEARRGAHKSELLAPPSVEELRLFMEHIGPMAAHFTLAPELPGGEAFVRAAAEAGATVALGHSDASYEEAVRSFSYGVTAVTHLFNALPPLHHRNPGPIGAALTEGVFVEIICDGFHLHPAAVKTVWQAAPKDKLVLITDSLAAARCSDGDYVLAGLKVFVRNGMATNEEGHIAGSTISLYDAVRNLMRFCGASLSEALPFATINPARMVGLDALVGSIEKGKRADFCIIDPKTLEISQVISGGVPLSAR